MNQFGRKASLIVSVGTTGLDLSQLHFTFEVKQSDISTPNNAYIRIFNLDDGSVARIQNEFTSVILQAGYENGNFGIIFQGTITQVFKGRERNVDSFVDIYAADGDSFHNFATLNATIAAGATPQQVASAIFQQSQVNGKSTVDTYPYAASTSGLLGGIPVDALARGKTLYGMARNYARDWAAKHSFRWSIQNGQVTLVPVTGYLPGQAVEISPMTGLIGIPAVTNDGVQARVLLNPLIQIGCLVHIPKDLINTGMIKNVGDATLLNGTVPSYALTPSAGYYRILVAEQTGDTRGQPWYTDLTCLAVDVSAPADASVKADG